MSWRVADSVLNETCFDSILLCVKASGKKVFNWVKVTRVKVIYHLAIYRVKLAYQVKIFRL